MEAHSSWSDGGGRRRGDIFVNAYDVIIVGAGPAGSTAAALLASSGKRVLLLDRSKFPRDKVCGDCLNPSAWRILERLSIAETIRALHPTEVQRVEFAGIYGHVVAVDLPRSDQPEIVVRRRDFDELLVRRAVACGAEFRDGCAVTSIDRAWIVNTSSGQFSAPVIFAADGRNSTVGRMLGCLPAASRERIAIQAHVPSASLRIGHSVRMFFHRLGYGGIASINADLTNLCLVSKSKDIDALRAYAETQFHLGPNTHWNSITPLQRADASPISADGVFLLGDAARVVEPFTGEGIYYAMRSGEIAADSMIEHSDISRAASYYAAEHRKMYRGRLWVNLVSRFAALHPTATSRLLPIVQNAPAALALLTRKVTVLKR